MARLYRTFLAQFIPVSILSIVAGFLCYFYLYLPKDVKLLAGIVVSIIAISFILQAFRIVIWFIDRKYKTDYPVKVLRNLKIFCSGSILFALIPCIIILYFGVNGPALTYTIIVSNVSVIHLAVLFLNRKFFFYIREKSTVCNCCHSKQYPEKIMYKIPCRVVAVVLIAEFCVLILACRLPQDLLFILIAHAFYGCLWIVPNFSLLCMLLDDEVAVDDMLICNQRFRNVIKSADGEECCLCMEEYNQSDRTPQVLATCGHTMCKSCLETMKGMHYPRDRKCPFCRTKYPLNETATETYRHKVILDKIRKQDRKKEGKWWISSCV